MTEPELSTTSEKELLMSTKPALAKKTEDLKQSGVELAELMETLELFSQDLTITFPPELLEQHLELCFSLKELDSCYYLDILILFFS